ncbi:actin-like ATPase domain-containing protein [Ascodesmis nigricans]|uniref:Actin-like ATPase domain-containing protein n=1 Tax=Ascodesmis nigricans TaxID=341454 RepID=A0A4S2MYA8_9PEZI|nr:actin-like ATPase domain-containing protein [Ascodesmis nigricans]
MGKAKSNKPRFVCGIDFGTTFTSVAFAHSSSPDEVKLVQTWPNGTVSNNDSADDVPTQVLYVNPRTNPRTKLWGYEVPTDSKDAVEPLKWFKLLLQERPVASTSSNNGEDRLVSSVRSLLQRASLLPATPLERTAEKLKVLNLKPVDVATDFLSSVREHAFKCISASYDKDFVAQSKIEYILTIPAIWTDQAKALVVQAARKAKMGTHRVNFHLVSEPEAAAAYTFRVIQPHNLKVGESIVVCDAGGGTCDLVSYEIGNLIPLMLNEAVSGTGDLCGSVYLDQAFDKYIRQLLGNARVDRMKPRARQQMAKSFERVKIRFGNTTDSYFEVIVPGIADDDELNIEDGFHSMSSAALQAIFDPVVDRIVELVRQQITSLQRQQKRIAAILLVGGFGSSAYLKQRIEKTNFGGQKIQVIQPVNARTAIARGALLRGLDGSIVYEKRCRVHYGITANSPYEPGQGLEAHRFWNAAHDQFYVLDKMCWYIKKEAVIGDNESVTFPFVRNVQISPAGEVYPHDFIFEDDLMACDLDAAPDFQWKNPSALRRICTVRSDLSKIPLTRFTAVTNCMGSKFYRITFNLKLSFVGDVMNFELLFQGKRCGSVTAKYETI